MQHRHGAANPRSSIARARSALPSLSAVVLPYNPRGTYVSPLALTVAYTPALFAQRKPTFADAESGVLPDRAATRYRLQ